MKAEIFSGVIPALMTPCTPDRTPDFEALVRKGKELIAAGMSAVVYCGSMGDWPLLTDEQRMEGVERLVKAGVKVVVGTGAINTASAVAITRHAAKAGAHGLMVIPPFLEDPENVRPYFARLRSLRDQAAERGLLAGRELSMGMSHDFEVAIEEGATIVRVGTAIFGERPPKPL